MTSGELRLLILVLGLLFIAAVYLWERHKRTQKEIRKKREYAEAFDDPDVLGEQINELDMLVTQREKSIPYIQASDPEFEGIVSLEPEPSVVLDDHPGVSPGETAARAQRSDAILIISIASNKKFFSGDAIMSSLRALNLVPGPMDVFYRYDETQESILYTVASMVEPGTFPVDDMSRYMTSGLTLFGLDLYFASPAMPAIGISTIEFLSSAPNWRIVIDLLLIGTFGGFYIVPLYALVQARSAPDHRSRVIAGLNILNALFMVVAAIMAM
ncbi:MAG: cell division protein ZipA C-terminal FtsZ-binding domain-containing protein, partial [Gammaproteobacteria bacterium]